MNASRLAVASLTTYAAYITWKCPCHKTLSCHLPHFFLSITSAAVITLYCNDFKVS
tara:strand:+ start:2572 stop:2739 length:168 start_codon:yes stop_codon:yes gene_type:complete